VDAGDNIYCRDCGGGIFIFIIIANC